MEPRWQNYPLILVAAFATGFTALAYEVTATKALFYFFNESTYSTATVIAVFLFGLAVGSFLYGRFEARIRMPHKFFLFVQWGTAAYTFFGLPQFDLIPAFLNGMYQRFGSSVAVILTAKILVSFAYLILPTVLLGMLFPFLLSRAVTSLEEAGRRLSAVYVADLAGSVLGALTAGFFLIPVSGLRATIFFTALVNLFAGPIFFPRGRKLTILILVVIAGGTAFFATMRPFGAAQALYFRSDNPGESHFAEWFRDARQLETLFFANSAFGEVRVTDSPGAAPIRTLYIDRRQQCDTNQWDNANISEEHFAEIALRTFLRSGLEALSVGLGCGLTLGVIAENAKIARVDAVEINPVIRKAVEYFRNFNGNVLENPKINLIIDDGARYLANAKKRYDLIAVDIENPAVAFSSPLYTLEFFRAAKDAMVDDVIFAIWAYEGSDKFFGILYRTLAEVFPNVTMRASGAYKDTYFYASRRVLPSDAVMLSAGDIGRLKRIRALSDGAINTMDYQALSVQWAQEHRDF